MKLYTNCISIEDAKLYFKIDRLELSDNGIIIFMPSAKSDRFKDVRPYFPRVKWSDSLQDFCVIYVADPFDEPPYSERFRGSWFISPENGTSILPCVSSYLNELIPRNHGKILVYGSSMGGFAALYLGALLNADGIYAECPQIDLFDYPGSKGIAEIVLDKNNVGKEWTNVFSYYRNNGFPEAIVRISLNVGDRQHLRYLYKELINESNEDILSSLNPRKFEIKISCYEAGFGHVNFNLMEVIEDIKGFFE